MSHSPCGNVDCYPIANLLTIDNKRLQDGDEKEAAKLIKAAKEDGVFYLDLRDERFTAMRETVEEVYTFSKELFDLDEEKKMEYDIDRLGRYKLHGYWDSIVFRYIESTG